MDVLEKEQEKLSVEKEIIELMPVNNKKNREARDTKITDSLFLAEKKQKEIYEEIESRYNKFLKYSSNEKMLNDKYDEITEELENLKYALNILNGYNSSYEKLGIDFALHKLNYYYVNDLSVVNKVIIDMILRFNEIGLDLNLKDFEYSKFSKEYLSAIFFEMKNKDLVSINEKEKIQQINENLQQTFNEIYWKCPDLVTHIKMSFRDIYNKNEKKIVKSFKEKQRKILEQTNEQILKARYVKLLKEKNLLEKDNYINIINSFLNEEDITNTYKEDAMYKEYQKYVQEVFLGQIFKDKDNNLNKLDKALINLKYAVIELQFYNKYKFVFDEIKNKYVLEKNAKKENVIKYKTIKKEINKIEKNIKKIQSKEKGIFAKKLNDSDKVKLNDLILQLDEKYKEYDELDLNNKIFEKLNDSSSVEDVLEFISSYTRELFRIIKKENYEVSEDENLAKVEEVILFSKWPYKNLINNLNIKEEKNFNYIIKDKYKLLNIVITNDMLEPDNLNSLIDNLRIFEKYYYIRKNNIDLNIIEENIEFKKIINLNGN